MASGMQVCSGACLGCTFGSSPSNLSILPESGVFLEKKPAGTIFDNKPMVNIAPFGLCSSPSNPQVSAALGTPQPCVPNITAPWTLGVSNFLLKEKPTININSKLMCSYGGVITVINPGQTKEMI